MAAGVQPGDLDRMFRAASAPEAAHDAHVLSRDPWVVALDSFLTTEEVEALAARAARARQAGTDARYPAAHRNNTVQWCDGLCKTDATVRRVEQRAAAVVGLPVGNAEDMQFARYESGGYYRTHHDQNTLRDEPWGVRMLTVLMYLSETAAGTEFPEAGLAVAAKAGRAVLWANVLTGEEPADAPELSDPRTYHRGQTVPPQETKLIATLWFHRFDYRSFREVAGCPLMTQWSHPHHSSARPWSAVDNVLVFNGSFAGYEEDRQRRLGP